MIFDEVIKSDFQQSDLFLIKCLNHTFNKVINLMDLFDEVMDGQIFDQLYGFRQSDFRRCDPFPKNVINFE